MGNCRMRLISRRILTSTLMELRYDRQGISGVMHSSRQTPIAMYSMADSKSGKKTKTSTRLRCLDVVYSYDH